MKKNIISFAFVFLFLVISNFQVEASTLTYPKLDLSKGEYYIIAKDKLGRVVLGTSSVPFTANDNGTYFYGDKVDYPHFYYLSEDFSSWEYSRQNQYLNTNSKDDLLYNNNDIYSSLFSDRLLFTKKPVPSPVLSPIVEGIQMSEVLTVTLTLVGSVVSLTVLSLAFRKSLTWLYSLLKSS